MKFQTIIITASLLLASTTSAIADSLVLSDAEIQKLRRYFPTNDDISHYIWKGDPISIQLPINQEKRIVFSTHVTFDAKGALTTDQLRIINNDKSIYLTALKSIPTTRIYVTLQDTNEVVLIDLSTSEKANSVTTTIDIQQNNSNASISVATNNNVNTTADNLNKIDQPLDNDTYVSLTRYAWQQLYAPERLLTNPLNITRASMHTEFMLSTLIYGDKVYAHPAISWTYNNAYITAVELRNKYPHPTTINIARDLCGNWQAASLYPRTHLKPAGDKTGDSTMLFVISNQSFGNSMEVCNVHA